jgi:hypothetical protein
MKSRLMAAAAAAALSLSLVGGSVSAQELGLQQLQDSATSTLAQLGMSTEMVGSLTLEELAQIQSVTSGSATEAAQIQQIETILRGAEERIAAGGAVEPTGTTGDITPGALEGDRVVAANVGTFLTQIGMHDVDVNTLSTEELLRSSPSSRPTTPTK